MGTCACVYNPSTANSGSTAFVDIPPHDTSLQIIPLPVPPPNEEISPIEKHMKKSKNATKSKSNSTLHNAKTQCSSSNQEALINELKLPKPITTNNPTIHNDMLKEQEDMNECITKPIINKVIYKSVSTQNDNNIINIVIFGDKNTGKSAFVIKYVDNYFEKLYIPSISVEKHDKKVKYGKMTLKFIFWVTPGDNGYKGDYKTILNEADFIFVFYDVSVCGSFDIAKKYCLHELKEYHKEYMEVTRNVVFIGNKMDVVPRKESKEQVETYCTEEKIKFFEISVKNGFGIKDIMQFIAMTHLKLLEEKEKVNG